MRKKNGKTNPARDGTTRSALTSRRKRRQLVIESNLRPMSKIFGWERELLLPVIGDLLETLLTEENDDDDEQDQ